MAPDSLPYPVLAVGGGGDQSATPMGSGCSRAEPASGLGPTAEHPSRGPEATDLALSLDEACRLIAWGDEHTSGLRRHRSWLKDTAGKPLPGTEIVIPEIDHDIGVNLALMLRLYEHRNALQAAAQAIEARRAETRSGSVHESAVVEDDAPKGS